MGEQRKGGTHPRVFCAKSSELHEKKRVEFWIRAKNDKRVRKHLKIKEMRPDVWRLRWPGCSRGVYSSPNLQGYQNKEVENGQFVSA
jgi:hypothetical protein